MYIFSAVEEIDDMNMRKYMIFIIPVLALILIIYLFFPHMYIKIVTNSVDDLERATINIYIPPYDYVSPKVIEIDEKSMLDKLYFTIKGTTNTRINRYPRHSVVMGTDQQYEIQLFYNNGKVDRFGTPANPQLVYRVLKNDDNGYIMGQNNDLLEYVLYLANNNQ